MERERQERARRAAGEADEDRRRKLEERRRNQEEIWRQQAEQEKKASAEKKERLRRIKVWGACIMSFLFLLLCTSFYYICYYCPRAHLQEDRALSPFRSGKKWGFVDITDGHVVIEPQFDYAFNFSEGLAGVGVDGRLEGGELLNSRLVFVNRAGETIFETKKRVTKPVEPPFFKNGAVMVVEIGPAEIKSVLFNRKGCVIMEADGDGHLESDGIAEVGHFQQKNFVDTNSVPFTIAKYVSYFSSRLAQWVAAFAPRYDHLVPARHLNVAENVDIDFRSFSEGLYVVHDRHAERYGYADRRGTIVIEPAYEMAGTFHEGLASVRIAGKWGFIDKAGKQVIPPQYDLGADSTHFSEGLCRVWNDRGQEGYIDKKGSLLIPYKYPLADDFQGGLAQVHNDDGWIAYINRDGKIVRRLPFAGATDFSSGRAVIWDRKGRFGIIDISGKVVVSPGYDDIIFPPATDRPTLFLH